MFGVEQAMYSVMTYYIAFKTIDTVIQGLDETKAVLIVSDQYEEVSNAILHRLGRGTTKLVAKVVTRIKKRSYLCSGNASRSDEVKINCA